MSTLPTNMPSLSHDLAPHTSATSASEASIASAPCPQPANGPGAHLPVRAPQAALNALVPQSENASTISLFEPRRALKGRTSGKGAGGLHQLHRLGGSRTSRERTP
ncbi:hypothetical protein [Streptomyces coerulescens]|uniref:Uncharacterized protein n=1 Tax=Streptomyces coerulescens TaxID=29304 RepID=A0ABW0CY22_STRCD